MDRLDVLFQKTPLKGETPNPLRMFFVVFSVLMILCFYVDALETCSSLFRDDLSP